MKLMTKGHKKNLGVDGNNLYLDYGGGCMTISCQNFEYFCQNYKPDICCI